jgi:hypothetical protein
MLPTQIGEPVSGITQLHAVGDHPGSRTAFLGVGRWSSGCGVVGRGRGGRPDELIQFTQPVAAPVDVDVMGAASSKRHAPITHASCRRHVQFTSASQHGPHPLTWSVTCPV